MLATWRCTVWGLTTSAEAISASLIPWATSRRTSCSRGVVAGFGRSRTRPDRFGALGISRRSELGEALPRRVRLALGGLGPSQLSQRRGERHPRLRPLVGGGGLGQQVDRVLEQAPRL